MTFHSEYTITDRGGRRTDFVLGAGARTEREDL